MSCIGKALELKQTAMRFARIINYAKSPKKFAKMAEVSKILCTFADKFSKEQMSKPRIIIDDAIPYIKGVFEGFAEVEYLPYQQIGKTAVKDADALIIRTRTKCNRALLEESGVKVIATATIGMDHIDLDYCREKGIVVKNAPGCNARSVAQWVGTVLTVWNRENDGKRLGIVGYGHVGKEVRKIAELLGYQVRICDPLIEQQENFGTLEEVVRWSDIVTLHTPLTFEGKHATHYLINRAIFEKLREGALLINAARGGVTDENALKEWLSRSKKNQCAIDCWENEPEIDKELIYRALIATPHIAGYSADGKWNGTRMAVETVSELLGIGHNQIEKLPAAECKEFSANALSESYDIMRECRELKAAPEDFEKMRKNYRVRRELNY